MKLKIDNNCILLLNKLQDLALKGNGIGAFKVVQDFVEYFNANKIEDAEQAENDKKDD